MLYLPNLYRLLCFAGLLMTTTTCIERFEFEREEDQSFVVIEGLLTQGTGPHYVSIKRTTFFSQSFENTPTIQVSAVSLVHEESNARYFYQVSDAPGRYVLEGQVDAQPGQSYYIEVELESGRLYRSKPEVLPPALQTLAANTEVVFEETVNSTGNIVEKLLVDVTLDTYIRQNSRAYPLRFRLEDSFFVLDDLCGPFDVMQTCYFTQDINTQDVILFDGSGLQTDIVNDILLTKVDPQPRYAYAGRHYFHIYQYSMTQSAYNYWQDIKKIANQSGSIFNAPPAPVRGNIFNVNNPNELVLGFFEASGVSTALTFTENIDFFPTRFNPYCGAGSIPPVEGACCFCTLLPNASTERPDFYP